MPQSLSNILVHLTFSTKDRRADIDGTIEPELHHYLGGVCGEMGCQSLGVGGTPDHVHICVRLWRTVAVADLVEEIKKRSSKWIKTQGPRCRYFTWQAGYGAFSIGQSGLAALQAYIARQKDHHRRRDFKAEFRALLEKYEVAYDERYVWE
ncbi:MAG: IS200/IS605 family transposase [Planctomycetota bacterium]